MSETKCLEQKVNDKLLEQGYITKSQYRRLIIRDGKVFDNTRCNWSISDNGDVEVTESGAYPFTIKRLALDVSGAARHRRTKTGDRN